MCVFCLLVFLSFLVLRVDASVYRVRRVVQQVGGCAVGHVDSDVGDSITLSGSVLVVTSVSSVADASLVVTNASWVGADASLVVADTTNMVTDATNVVTDGTNVVTDTTNVVAGTTKAVPDAAAIVLTDYSTNLATTHSPTHPTSNTHHSHPPSYHQFCHAIDAYAFTHAGGHPSTPSKHLYLDYLEAVHTASMSLAEQAMFLANIVWESGGLATLEEHTCVGIHHPTHHCPYGQYHGRGYMQISWRENYHEASHALFHDDRLVHQPDLLLEPAHAWKSAMWFWTTRVRPLLVLHDAVERGALGFAVNAINGAIECSPRRHPKRHGHKRSHAAHERLVIYKHILQLWHLSRHATLEGCDET